MHTMEPPPPSVIGGVALRITRNAERMLRSRSVITSWGSNIRSGIIVSESASGEAGHLIEVESDGPTWLNRARSRLRVQHVGRHLLPFDVDEDPRLLTRRFYAQTFPDSRVRAVSTWRATIAAPGKG